MREFTVKRIKGTEIRPADIRRNNFDLIRFFHHRVVDGIRRNFHHVFVLHPEKFIFPFRFDECRLAGDKHIGSVLFQFAEECRNLEAKNAAVPEEVSVGQIFLRFFQIRFFDKTFDIFTVGFNVAITGFGTRRRNAESDKMPRFRQFFRLCQNF